MAVRRWTVGYHSQSHVVTTNLSLSLSQFSDPTHTPRSPRVATSRMYVYVPEFNIARA